MSRTYDRVVGVVACLAALATAIAARSFRVGFYTDPLGPAGLPYVVAALIGAGGLVLVFRATPAAARETVPPARGLVVTVGLLGYSVVLPVFGFVLSTTAVIVLLGAAFGEPARRTVVAALAYTALLFLMFSTLLGLSLPIGTLFLRGA